jgi:peptide deformylase
VTVQSIRLFGDPILRTPADPVTVFDKELRTLVADLDETMLDAPGVGLAAPQIGVGLRVFAYHLDEAQFGHLVNPVLHYPSDEDQDGPEGCLSIPHETDHLDGVLFVDRLDTETKKAAMKAIREAEWSGLTVGQVKVSPHPTFGRAL